MQMPTLATLVVAMAAVAAAAPARITVGPTLVPTDSGPVQGSASGNARYWKGIPYATPPVGEMRWQNPMPAPVWSQPRQAMKFGAACPQDCNLPGPACQSDISEDCLFLNVYAPLTSNEPLPVLVFFHGGRYEQGSAGVDLYDGSQIANLTNTIVVTVNYRLGVLGFLTLPGGFVGNYGVLDQRLALQWVQANIEAFGGDRSGVTIFGQSAGATSVSFHLVSKGSWGLFRRAIVESSPYSLPLLTSAKAYERYGHFAAEANCSTLSRAACLRNLTWPAVVAAQTAAQAKIYLDRPLSLFFPWTPTVDGQELTDDPLTLMNRGAISPDVDSLVLGNVAEEAWIFVFEAFGPLTKAEAIALIVGIFRGKHEPEDIFRLYPLPEKADDYRPWVSKMASDFIIVCSGRNVSNALNQRIPVFRYDFDHAWSVKGAWGPNYPFCDGHVCHGAELPFVFDTAAEEGYNFTAAEIQLSKAMATSWGNFAHTANPNAGSLLPTWPRHYDDSDMSMVFSTNGSAVVSRVRAEYCNFWDQEGYIF